MLKYSHVILAAAAYLAAACAEAADAPAPAEASGAAPVPAASAPAAAAQGEAPRAAAKRGVPPRASEASGAEAARGKAIARLKNFLTNTRTAQADFTQAVLDKYGKLAQSTSGVMHFSRPGRFRWSYLKPYEQIIVGDGEKFWLYDVDLNQVTVKKLDAALGSSPAALLAGSREIERDFTLTDIECKPKAAPGQQAAAAGAGENAPACEDGLEWLEARPKLAESNFERIRMAFNAQSDLVVMELRDTFGHVTVLRFSNFQHNPRLPAALFKFEPPKGADILGE